MDEDKNKIDDFPYDAVLSGADKITSDHIVEQFKSMILSDKIPAGYPLPNENTLCEKLGTGRSTLREAFKVLEAYGLITVSYTHLDVYKRQYFTFRFRRDLCFC